ncbi:creatininase family protein [Rhodosalinus sp.]|uniref:creatininase family protein n=1 Tax=Rhodosalinus sp. TaxID=2047741 RepID=UPI003979D610
MKRFWSDYTSEEFSRLDRESLVAVLPVGATEQHGPHLPMKVDACVAEAVVERLVRKLPEESRTLFLPLQAIGKSNEHLRYPGTLTHSAGTLTAMWCEIGACVARAGVRKMVLLNAHGGNIPVMETVARELRVRHDMLVFSVNWFGQGMPEGVYPLEEMRHGIHAGDMETSVMLALDPGNVRMDHAKDFRPLSREWEAQYRYIALSGGAKPAWQAQDMHPEGACGNAAAASAEKGEMTLDFATDRLVELLAEVERAPLSWLKQEPAW